MHRPLYTRTCKNAGHKLQPCQHLYELSVSQSDACLGSILDVQSAHAHACSVRLAMQWFGMGNMHIEGTCKLLASRQVLVPQPCCYSAAAALSPANTCCSTLLLTAGHASRSRPQSCLLLLNMRLQHLPACCQLLTPSSWPQPCTRPQPLRGRVRKAPA